MRMTRVPEVLLVLAIVALVIACVAYGTSDAPTAGGQTVLALAGYVAAATIAIFVLRRLLGLPGEVQIGPWLALAVTLGIAVTATKRANRLAHPSTEADPDKTA